MKQPWKNLRYAVVPAERLLPVPDDLADEQVASFLINPASAILMLRHVLAIPQGECMEPKRTEAFVGRLPLGNYLLKALAKLDLIISRRS